MIVCFTLQGLFHHPLIVDTLAQAHFSNIIAISDPKSATRPIGAVLLTIQAVRLLVHMFSLYLSQLDRSSEALSMWSMGSFIGDAPELSLAEL